MTTPAIGEDLLRRAYASFNVKDVDALLVEMGKVARMDVRMPA